MSLPLQLPDGTVPQIAPEFSIASEEIEIMATAGDEIEKSWQFRQLSDRQVMETKQELDRIEQMGNVHKLLHKHIAAKICRNLQAKSVNGPLGKGKDTRTSSTSDITSPLTSPKQIPPPPPIPIHIQADSGASRDSTRRTSGHNRKAVGRSKLASKKNWIVGSKNLGEFRSSFEKSQKKELEDIKGMQVVKNHLANRRRARSLAHRMFNTRVNNSRTKTSILLTGSEPDQEEMVQAMRHMNRFVIEKFLQTHSRNRRVLERLNSIQVKTISDVETTKAQNRKLEQVRRRSDSSLHEAMIIEEAEERELEEERKGVKRPHKRASFSSFSSFSSLFATKDKTSDALKKVWEYGVHGVQKLNFRSSSKRHSAAVSTRDVLSRKKRKGSRRLKWKRAEREKMSSYADEDETFSKSSGTDEVDTASPNYSGTTLEPLMEKAALVTPPVKNQESMEGDKPTSPLSPPGGILFLPPVSGATPPVFTFGSHQVDTLIDQAVPVSTTMATSPPQSPPTQWITLSSGSAVAPPTSAPPFQHDDVYMYPWGSPKQAAPPKPPPPPGSLPLQSTPLQAPSLLQQAPPTTPTQEQIEEAPPTTQSVPPPPPPPFQAHGLPTTLNVNSPPGHISTNGSSMEVAFDAVTPSGYQADTEYQELSQERNAGLSKPFPPQTQLSAVSSEDCMQETPSKRARLEEADDRSAEFDDFQNLPVLQPQLVIEESAKTHSVVAEDHYSHRDEVQVVPILVDADCVEVVGGMTSDDEDDMWEKEQTGGKGQRSGVSRRRVVHEEASIDHQEDKNGGEAEMEVVKEKGSSSNYQETPSKPKNLSSKKSSSLENRRSGSDDATRTPPRAKRHFSSPYISMSGESQPHIRPSYKPKPTANHAYYTPIEIDEEFNPFNYEFEQDTTPSQHSPEVVPKSKGSRVDSDSARMPFSQRSPRVSPRHYDSPRSPRPRASPGQPCRTAEVKQKSIPPSAYDDPNFRQYIKTLSHQPTYDDYLSFRVFHRLVVIGDDIEVRYKDKINNALDNIYMDIMKKTFSFEKFSAIANRLLLECKRMQEGVFMIPLLARRWKEEVTPQMAGAVGKYSEQFMDNFVMKYIMNMGGWGNIVESYEDVEVYDEHPSYYGNEETHVHVVGDSEEDFMNYVHHRGGGASNYDHLYDGGVHIDNHMPPPPIQDHGLNMNEIGRGYYLDTYEDDWASLEEVPPPTREEIFLTYLLTHHPYLLEEPNYLKRVNSVDVLFQENTEPSDNVPPSSDVNNDGEATNHKPARKCSSQMSLARSLSADSLASPGLGSGAFCASPTASSTFLSRRFSRTGALKNPAPPAESPTKSAFPPSHSPIMEQVDYPLLQEPPQSGIISVSKGGKQPGNSPSHTRPPPLPSLTPNPAPPMPHPVSLPPPFPVHVPSPQVSVGPSPMPPYHGQSSGDNYEYLYDSGPSRSNSSNSDAGSHASKVNSENKKSNGVQHQTKTDGKHKEPQPRIGTNTWVVPVAIVTVGVVLIAGYYYLKRRS